MGCRNYRCVILLFALQHENTKLIFNITCSLPQPYWAAGYSFSRGHFVATVPYDLYQVSHSRSFYANTATELSSKRNGTCMKLVSQ